MPRCSMHQLCDEILTWLIAFWPLGFYLAQASPFLGVMGEAFIDLDEKLHIAVSGGSLRHARL